MGKGLREMVGTGEMHFACRTCGTIISSDPLTSMAKMKLSIRRKMQQPAAKMLESTEVP